MTKQAAAKAYRTQFDEWSVIAVELQPEEDRIYSWLGNALARQNPNCDFAWLRTSDGKNHFRSHKQGNNFDVRIPARRHGGGGHRNAAGF